MRRVIIEWGRLATAITVMTTVATTVLSFVVFVVFQVWGAQILSVAGVATSQELERSREQSSQQFAAIQADLRELSGRVVVLARPEQIVHYRDLPQALNGSCAPGGECVTVIFAERDLRALDCQVVPRRTQFLLTQGARTYAVPAVQRNNAINLGPSPRALEPAFVMPRSVSPGKVSAIIESHYENCLWQDDGEPPVVERSPVFQIEVTSQGDQR